MLPSERLDYSAINERPPLVGPAGKRMIIWIIVNVEEWDPRETMPRTALTPPAGGAPMPDIPNWAWPSSRLMIDSWVTLATTRLHLGDSSVVRRQNYPKDGLSGIRLRNTRQDILMSSVLKTIWNRLVHPSGAPSPEEPAGEAVEYNGYRIRPAPYQAGAGYQTAGVIEKDFPDGVREHRFIRSEMHTSRDAAAAFAIVKGRQIVDQQGDRIFTA